MLIGIPQIREKRERLYRWLMPRGGLASVPIDEYTLGIAKQPDWALFAPINRVHVGALSGGQTITGLDFSLVDADGNPASLDYDIGSLTVTSTSASGSSEVSLDASGNPICSVDEQGNVTLTQYADAKKGLPSSITSVVGLPDTLAQSAAGIGDDLTTAYSYNQWGQKTSETDPRGNTSQTVYNSQGYPAQEIDIFGNVTAYAFYDGQLSSTSDADGNSTQFSYDTFGNVNGVNQSNYRAGTSTSTTFDYNEFVDLVSTIDADGNTRKIAYDNLGRQTGTSFVWQDPLGILPNQTLTTSVDIGPDGNVDSSTDASGQTTTTLYDSAGRAWRTISGRVPISTLSVSASLASLALTSYPSHGTAADPYANQDLSSGVITDTLFDARGRQYASLGHPLPAADVGLSGTNYDDKLVRTRTEAIYDSLGQASVQRSGLAQVESTTGTLLGVYDVDSVDTKTYSDAFGNVYRTEFIIGGEVTYDSTTQSTTREDRDRHSYTLARFDDENRPIAEMQQTAGNIEAVWSEGLNSFIVVGSSTLIPTKLYEYNLDSLTAVELPGVPNPDNSNAVERPRYEYAYNAQGSQTLIRDPLGHETRFTFNAQGQQVTRTLPLGFGSDGIASAADLASLLSDPSDLSFTERTTYDTRGRQHLHVSFEGVVSENIYDGYGRLSHINYYADQTAFSNETISERWNYEYDSHGRKSAAIHSVNSGGVLTPDRLEETFYDARGRVIAESVPEGILGYSYDSQSHLASTAVFAAGDDPFIDVPERITSYGYDILGRLTTVQEDSTPAYTSDDPQLQTDYTFDIAGRADTTTIADPSTSQSVITDYDYDALGRLDIQTDKNAAGQTLASYDYTVRADGKRTALDEQFWFDLNSDGELTANELKANSYSWSYDNVGRLTDEAIDHWDDAFDQTESFIYDLTGNRLQLDRDHGNDGVDEVITYDYDVNDRLLTEILDDLTATNADTTTSYDYHNAANLDTTQQHSKTVTADSQTVSKQIFAYNSQGKMSSVVNEGYTAGTLSSRERTGYSYDSKSFRVGLVTETGTATGTIANETWTFKSSTSFLADSHNHTGYTQTIRETKVENGHTRITDYTFGHDEISQRVHGAKADGTPVDETLVFGHDGHGSVRVLYDLAATGTNLIEQVLTFAAYGQTLAVHNATSTLLGTNESFAKTSLGYSGEHFDAKAQQQYLRARFYSPTTGRFNRLDPFAGNIQDPQSLHKYTYVHGDPIGSVDPTGLAIEPYNDYDALTLSQLGTLAHQQFSNYVAENFGISNAGERLENALPAHFSSGDPGYDLKPDLVRPLQLDFFELKPITHRNSASRQLDDFASQIGLYDFYLNPHGLFRGSSAQIIPHQLGGYLVGYVSTPSKHYRMIAYPEHRFNFTESGLPSRGLLYYELIEERRDHDTPVPFIVTRHKSFFKEDHHDQNRDIKFYTVRKEGQRLVQDIDISIAARNIALAGIGVLAVRGAAAVGSGLGTQFAARMSMAISFRF